MIDLEQIARVCHMANREYCRTIGDHSQSLWEFCDDWQKESAIQGVKYRLENPDAPASAQHDAWNEGKLNDGWVYGPVKDPVAKTHPCLVPYERLPVEERLKDYLFRSVVDAFVMVEKDAEAEIERQVLQVHTLRSMYARVGDQLIDAQGEIDRLTTEIDRISKLNERQTRNAEEAGKSEIHWRQKVVDLQGEIEDLRKYYSRQMELLAQARGTLDQLETEVFQLRQRCAMLEVELQESQKAIATFQEMLEQEKEERDAKGASLAPTKTTHEITVIGYTGDQIMYIDVPIEECKRRYAEHYNDGVLPYHSLIETFTCTDELGVYDAWELP
jgi:predicted  nucleic acid-binding Zn-ribbon protein